MASIQARKRKSGIYYELVETVKGKSTTTAYLGTKPPWPKSQGWKNLSPEQVQRAKRKAVRRKVRPSPNPSLPEGKYAVIYADPPWRYDFVQVTDWAIEEHYKTLTTEEIKHYKDQSGVPLQDIFADNALLFLWSPQPKLAEALQVIEAWGFRYITGAVWVKNRLGMGYWWMQKHELLLLAKKGEFPTPLTKNRFPSVVEAGWNGHSTKPAVIYKMIEKMCPLPDSLKQEGRDYYLELFKRGTKRPFWVGFGQEYG